ncbi:MAG: DNA-binding response regulator [Rhizobacter sp.]|nr:DNA-binding response regulator [Rhizobacter sp.]
MIRVVLADDHPVVRSGYASLLEASRDVTVLAEAGNGDAAFAAYMTHRPDVMVTDLAMPGGGGIALVRRVRAVDAQARLLVFSMHDEAAMVRRAIDAGVSGYLTKASAPRSLVDAVRALHAGERYFSAGLAVVRNDDDESQRLSSLTSRELEVFVLLAQGHNVADCAQRLSLSPKTVANHQTILKDKLRLSTTAALVHLAVRQGVITSAGLRIG